MIYLDNAATTKPDQRVMDTYLKVSEEYYYNTASIHQAGRKAESLLEASRGQMKNLMGLQSYSCVFTAGATESNNIVIQSVLKAKQSFGRTVIVSELEHPSVINTLHAMNDGFNIQYVKTTHEGRVDVDHLHTLMHDDVIFVTVMAVNNIVGSVQPLKEIQEVLRNYPKAHFHVDATQAAGKIQLDYHNVDSISVSGHKFHGVKGIGALFLKHSKNIKPIIFGGGHEENIRSGTVNLPAISAMAKALRLTTESMDETYDRLSRYNTMVQDALSPYPSIEIQPNDVPHILNIAFKGAKGEVVVNALSAHGIMVSTTSACASKLHALNETLLAMNVSHSVIEGSIRISFSKETSDREINQLITALQSVYEELGDVLT